MLFAVIVSILGFRSFRLCLAWKRNFEFWSFCCEDSGDSDFHLHGCIRNRYGEEGAALCKKNSEGKSLQQGLMSSFMIKNILGETDYD